MATIKSFSEKEIRKNILNKVKPVVPKNRSKHQKGYIYLEGIVVSKVTIPNEHSRIMHQSKSKYIAEDLKISSDEFNQLIECTLSGIEYYEKLKKNS